MIDINCFASMLGDGGAGYRLEKYVLDNYKIDENIFQENFSKLESKDREILKNAISRENYEKTRLKLEKYHIKCICYLDKAYPQNLLNIDKFPLVVYYKGNIDLLQKRAIAIVGTRRPTVYGRQVTEMFASKLSLAGLVTVSGLAYGLDMETARATINQNGKTIAVLAGGLDSIYPSQNSALAEQIVERGGLLISLYPPLKRPAKYSFVERNRIISALSEGTIIIEAGENSGTLNTASHTIEQGKELFVVPGNINMPSFAGSNNLIFEMPETFTISPDQVLKALKIETNVSLGAEKKSEKGEAEKTILNLLYKEDLDFDSLLEGTNLDSKTLIRKLTTMEIDGLIKKLPNNFYSLAV